MAELFLQMVEILIARLCDRLSETAASVLDASDLDASLQLLWLHELIAPIRPLGDRLRALEMLPTSPAAKIAGER